MTGPAAAPLHARFPLLAQRLPRVELCATPTPVRELRALSARLGAGVPLWLKDDARVAPLWGGNKPRKLEWTLADAIRRRRGTVLTFGALATNHGLATALYARSLGLRCVLALVDQPVDDHVEAQLERIRASGARVHLTRTTARTIATLPYLLARYAQPRPPRLPYWLPPGGSSPLGAVGFVDAALELAGQVEAGLLPAPAVVVVPLGTGGTAAGLLVGLRAAGLRARVMAVRVNDRLRLSSRTILALARRTRRLLARRGADLRRIALDERDVAVPERWLGAGYGHRTPAAEAALALARETEDLRLEPVYTAKAMAALVDTVREEPPDGPVVFWNTHGAVP